MNSAKASFIAVLASQVGNIYTYDINFLNAVDAGTGLPSERLDALNTGNNAFVTVYDLFGVTSANISLTGPGAALFNLTTSTGINGGLTPAGVLPVDGPLINFTVTYKGPATTLDLSSASVVAVVSSSTTSGLSNYTGQTTKNAGAAAGTVAANIGFVLVPTNPVPEPAAMFLMGGGLLALGAISRRKLNKSNLL